MQNKTKRYKWCFVPQCTNTSACTPNKVFVYVPQNVERRKAWLKAARRDVKEPPTAELYCCEDHFNMQEDMENYMYHKIMGVKLIAKKDCIPHLFNCQSDRKRAAPKPVRLGFEKRNRKLLVEEDVCAASRTTVIQPIEQFGLEQENEVTLKSADENPFSKIVASKVFGEVALYRSKYVHCDSTPKTTDNATSSFKMQNITDTTTSPIEVYPEDVGSTSSECEEAGNTPAEDSSQESESENSCTSDNESTINSEHGGEEIDSSNKQVLSFIFKKPKPYLGIRNSWYWLVEFIQSKCGNTCSTENILLTLTKIRLNDSFGRLGDQFSMSAANATKIFSITLPKVACLLKTLIYWPSEDSIKAALPISFRLQYSHVQSIIGCLEIEIQKPTNPVMQALTWSSCKKCNTLKYVVSATPDGFINFISTGYGGHISDILIFEKCGFLDVVPTGCGVMADRRFKHIQNLLKRKNCELAKPLSVSKTSKPTQEEVLNSKCIASIRIQIERIIRRLQEFAFLQPHSVIHHNMLDYTDDIMIVACALTNTQM